MVAMVAASCSSDDDAFEVGGEGQCEGTKITLFASVDDNNGEGTRSTFTEYEDADGKWVDFKWAKGDQISVFTTLEDDWSIAFTLDEESDGQGNGIFTGTIPEGKTMGTVALYPHHGLNNWETLYMPAVHDYSDKEYTPDTHAPLYGTINGNAISFKYLTGVVKVTLRNVPAGASEFIFTTPGKKISNELAIETSGGEKVINVADENDYNYTYQAYDFKPLTEAQDMVFYVPLPVGTYENGFKIGVYEIGETYSKVLFEKVTTSAKTINRAEVMPMKALDAADFKGYELTGNTFTVYTAEGLQAVNKIISDDFDTYASHNITLVSDITLTGENNWTTIGNNYYPYNGTFDGNGKSITGLHINRQIPGSATDDALIANLGTSGTVKNLTLNGCTVVATSGNAAAIAATNNGTIEGCKVWSLEEHGVRISGSNAGGIAAVNNGTISNCIVDCWTSFEINSTDEEMGCAGGIAGYCDNYSAAPNRIIACLAWCISVSGKTIGGIVGTNNSAAITGCYAIDCLNNDTALSGEANIYGNNGATVTHCYYTADFGETFGHVGGNDANTDWTSIVSAMNAALESYGLTWGGEAHDPTVTAAE